MPTYEYRCGQCGAEFEVFQKITEKPGAPCPSCGASAERLLSAGVGLVFKGSGFYITDYKRAGQKPAGEGGAGQGEKGGEGQTGAKAKEDQAAKPPAADRSSSKRAKDD
jgi:putative FmdB family regulatory protein